MVLLQIVDVATGAILRTLKGVSSAHGLHAMASRAAHTLLCAHAHAHLLFVACKVVAQSSQSTRSCHAMPYAAAACVRRAP